MSSRMHSAHTAVPANEASSSSSSPPSGLSNLGNTCFMNAVLQCLLRTEALVAAVKRPGGRRRMELTTALQTLIEDIARSKGAYGSYLSSGSVAPSAVKQAVGKFRPAFVGYGQQDSQEFLRFLLEGVHEEIKRNEGKPAYEEMKDIDGEHVVHTSERWWKYHKKRDDSAIYDIFGGQLKSSVTCTSCGTTNLAFDPFLDLSIPVPATQQRRFSVENALSRFTEREHLDGADKFHCRKCKKAQPSVKDLKIMRLPNILVIHLKRFERGFSKVGDEVELSKEIDMARYVDRHAESLSENRGTTYKLYGMVNHSGSLWGGHYTAIAREVNSTRWYTFDDSRVSPTDVPAVSGQPYLLFYVRSNQAVSSKPPLREELYGRRSYVTSESRM